MFTSKLSVLLSFLYSFNIFCAISAQADLYAFRVSPSIGIVPVEEGHKSDLGVVNGVRTCGGSGRLVEWRYEPCQGEGICKIPGDGQPRRSELEFIPSQDADALGVRFNVVTENGAKTVYDRPLPNSSVQGGKTYLSSSAGGPPKEMVGKTYTFQYILYQVDNGDVEICAEADFEVVEA